MVSQLRRLQTVMSTSEPIFIDNSVWYFFVKLKVKQFVSVAKHFAGKCCA